MALVDRIARLFRADLNAVLDQMEEPEQLLKQAIRDMEDELAAAEQRIAMCGQDQAGLAVRASELADTITGFERQLDLCFASGKEELARNLIRKKLEAERLLKRLHSKCAANEQFLAEQRMKLREHTGALDALRQKAELFAHRPSARPTSDSDGAAWMTRELDVGDDEVEIAYLREKHARNAP